jgi:hypothetical protein
MVAQKTNGYHVTKTFQIASSSSWDYVVDGEKIIVYLLNGENIQLF